VFRLSGVLSVALFVSVASAQTTTNFTVSLNITGGSGMGTTHAGGIGDNLITTFGPVTMSLDFGQPIDNNGKSLGPYTGSISFVFNRLDSFDVGVGFPAGTATPTQVTGSISNGKGAYQGATGSVTFTYVSMTAQMGNGLNPGAFSISATGSVTVAGKTTALTLPNTVIAPLAGNNIFRDLTTGNGTMTPGGPVKLSITGHGGDNNTRQTIVATVSFNANDSITSFSTFIGNTPPNPLVFQIFGGTGVYAGATGSFSGSLSQAPDGSISYSGSGSYTLGVTGLPVITEVTTAFGNAEIATNGWTVIKGKNLVPANTPSTGVIWSNAPEFATGKMPTQLNGISVTVNGVPAYVYFYCSAATDTACATDQINVLTPIDNLGSNTPAAIVVTNGSVSSAPFFVNENASIEPSFLLFSTKGHVVGVHLDASLLGPTTLYPGSSTPAKVGETVLLFPIGFGLPKGNVTPGSATQSGALPGQLGCTIGGRIAKVAGAIISPGLTQLNVTIPNGTPSGDNLISCGYQLPDGSEGYTPAGNLITVQ
jgi:uncharacterized protein (TIGR03437 family)